MRTAARTQANQRNARRSTGPHTREGKARVAKNALRHGLAVPVAALTEFNQALRQLVAAIAGEDADPAHLDAASRVAEAMIDLQRIRSVKRVLMEDLAVPVEEGDAQRVANATTLRTRWCVSTATSAAPFRAENRPCEPLTLSVGEPGEVTSWAARNASRWPMWTTITDRGDVGGVLAEQSHRWVGDNMVDASQRAMRDVKRDAKTLQ